MPMGCFEQTASMVAPQVGAYKLLSQLSENSEDEKLLSEYLKNIK